MAQGQVYVLWGVAVILGVLVISQFFRQPGLAAWKIAKSVVFGCLWVFSVNWVGQYFNYHLPFNPATTLTAGFLGIPGVVALVATQVWVMHV